MTDKCSHFYVDETGDLTFFIKNKPAHLDGIQTSKFFMIGMVHIRSNINEVEDAFNKLRIELTNNPFVNRIPSFKKTIKAFHARNDADIVKNEVFKLIKKFDFSVQVIVKRKEPILKLAMEQYKKTKIRTIISDKDIYNTMISQLFINSLHKNNCQISFSKRGKTFSDASLKEALKKSKDQFYQKHHINSSKNTQIICTTPDHLIGLQIIDYYLWTLQRLYEKNDDKFFNLVKEDFSLIIDTDDKRNHKCGEYYDQKNQISLEKIKGAS